MNPNAKPPPFPVKDKKAPPFGKSKKPKGC